MNWKQRAEAAEQEFTALEAEQEVILEQLDELTDYRKSINSILNELAHHVRSNRDRYALIPEEIVEALTMLSKQGDMNIPWGRLLGRNESYRWDPDNFQYDLARYSQLTPFITNPNAPLRISGV